MKRCGRDLSMVLRLDELPGKVPPLGYFDPLGLSSGRSANDKSLKRWRESELKHGRLAMLAFVGILTAEWGQGIRIPLFNAIEGPAIYHYQQAQELVPYLSLVILTIIGSLEAYRYHYHTHNQHHDYHFIH